ncbi:uncharacterized protein LOC121416451 [Lytechinus variegatus]|uniref:uncharacterized protein LOC121416451 n=1 Tax=Lytechinus variegatus TaxID=7654 RepID=UPI001BB107C1|nr:uncharacterized protein LOC121416451 [Lytechinus variegatus]
MFIVKVERLTGKFCGMVEDLPRYCIKHQGELSVGMEVEIGQRRCSSKDRVVEIKKPALKTRTTVNAELRATLRELKGQRQEKASPKYTTLADDQVLIGSSDASVTIGREVYLRAWESSSDAKDLVLRLVSTQFTREELAASNFNGGDVFNGKERTTKRGLREDSRFQAILAQAVIQFPGSLTNDQQRKQLRDAVNNKCRKSACLLR